MFIVRKEYDLGDGNKAPGYELFDDYNVRAQLTPVQVQELYLWLTWHADQIDKDITGEATFESHDEIVAKWKAEAKRSHDDDEVRERKADWLRLQRGTDEQ